MEINDILIDAKENAVDVINENVQSQPQSPDDPLEGTEKGNVSGSRSGSDGEGDVTAEDEDRFVISVWLGVDEQFEIL